MSLFNIFGTTPNETSEESNSQRPTTRSQSRNNQQHLTLPTDAVNTFNGIARGRRSPSPLAVGHNANSAVIFTYDSTNVSQRVLQSQQSVDAAEFENADDNNKSSTTASAMSLSQSSIEELRAAAAAAVEAANAATSALVAASGLVAQQSSQQAAQQIRTRKPELPEFDSKNIEIWIRRVQAAYDRAAVVLPKDKFAFLESKFAVGANPSIDAYLYGPANEESWQSFLSYLKEEYGRTVRQEAQYLRGQFSRDGRKPSQMLAHIKDKVKRVTIDDLLKEIVISSLPANVQQMMSERVKDLTADEAASVADRYFDQEGRPLHASSSHVHQIASPQVETTHTGEDDDEYIECAEVNAIRGRRGHFRGGYQNNNNRSSRPFNNNRNGRGGGQHRTPPSASSGYFNNGQRGGQQPTPSNSSSTPSSASSSKNPIICMQHQRYGDKSYSCQQGCSKWTEFQRRQAGNANAGNRK